MKKYLSLLLSSIILCSCTSYEDVDPGILSFVEAFSLDAAMNSICGAQVTTQGKVMDRAQENVYGRSTSSYIVSFEKGERFSYHYNESREGELVVFDTVSSLYVLDIVTDIVYDSQTGFYVETTKRTGYTDESNPDGIIDDLETVRYAEGSVSQFIQNVFYTTSTSGYLSGGYYYGSFIQNNLKYHSMMALKDDYLTFTYDNYPYITEQEEGYMNEVIYIDKLGMLHSIDQEIVNITTQRVSLYEVEAEYDLVATS